MSSLNLVQLIGRLGKDPSVKSMPSGDNVCNFSLATSEKHKDKTVTEWHNIVAFSKLADISSKYLKKGSLVYISGKLKTRSWEKDGHKNYTTEIVANSVQFLDSRDKEETLKEVSFDAQFADIPF